MRTNPNIISLRPHKKVIKKINMRTKPKIIVREIVKIPLFYKVYAIRMNEKVNV